MLNCFNEGFSDEEEQIIVCQMVPKVEVNFTRAHLQSIQPARSPASRVRTTRNPKSPLLKNSLLENPMLLHEEELSRSSQSVDRTREACFMESIEQSCSAMPGLAIDPVNYVQSIEASQPLTAASSFSQFKQVFCGSPSREPKNA